MDEEQMKDIERKRSSPEDKRHRLENLVRELLVTNERLRIQVAELEQRVEQSNDSMKVASLWSGGLL